MSILNVFITITALCISATAVATYVGGNPMTYNDPSGLIINDNTGGRIPQEVKDSCLYRALDESPQKIELSINNNLRGAGNRPIYGLATLNINRTVNVQINESLNSQSPRSYELLDTYLHELNHVRSYQNYFRLGSSELVDTTFLLPSVIKANLGKGGYRAPACGCP